MEDAPAKHEQDTAPKKCCYFYKAQRIGRDVCYRCVVACRAGRRGRREATGGHSAHLPPSLCSGTSEGLREGVSSIHTLGLLSGSSSLQIVCGNEVVGRGITRNCLQVQFSICEHILHTIDMEPYGCRLPRDVFDNTLLPN